MKPRALDLFCGAGGASMGLHLAGCPQGGDIKRPAPGAGTPLFSPPPVEAA